MPAFSADIFLNFIGLCVSLGSAIACTPEQLVDPEIGANCLEHLRELTALMPDEIYRMNPICLYERMANEDTIAYCPFAYTYSNYSRNGFAANHVRFSNPVAMDRDTPVRTVLGVRESPSLLAVKTPLSHLSTACLSLVKPASAHFMGYAVANRHDAVPGMIHFSIS